jgi:putative component of membrane protein insertase Oxa1/YidC/SpoIIIJ protein YidD
MADADCAAERGELRKLGCGAFAARVLIRSINLYQRYISPRKGFVCAHRVLHGGDSCSEAVKRAAAEHGVIGAWRVSRRQFQECRAAARSLKSRKIELQIAEEAERKRKKLQQTEGKLPHWLETCDCMTSGCSCWWP